MFDEEKLKLFIVAAVLSAFQQLPQNTSVAQTEPATEKRYIYSIKGLAEFLNCSVVTAQNLKNKGLVPFRQIGRKVMFDCDAVLAAMQNNKAGKGSSR